MTTHNEAQKTNTPDTEWEKEFDSFFQVFTKKAMNGKTVGSWNSPDLFTMKAFIKSHIASRDTYWKERVRELKLTEYEIEIIVQDTVGKAYQKKFNENLDYDQWVGIRDEMMRCARRISEKIENNIELNHQALTPLTNEDKLK